jgi:hypothetical protein
MYLSQWNFNNACLNHLFNLIYPMIFILNLCSILLTHKQKESLLFIDNHFSQIVTFNKCIFWIINYCQIKMDDLNDFQQWK